MGAVQDWSSDPFFAKLEEYEEDKEKEREGMSGGQM